MKPKKQETETNMTSMIDVVFLLIIFFLLNQFKTIEGHLDIFLPKDSGQAFTRPVEQEEIKDIRIFALQQGKKIKLRLDNFTIGTYPAEMIQYGLSDSSKADPALLNSLVKTIHEDYKEKLLPKLKSIKASGVKPNLVINIDPDVPYIFAVEAMDACLAAGIEDVKFAGQKKRLYRVKEGAISKIKRE